MKYGITKQPLSVTLVLFSVLALLFWFRHLFIPMAAETAALNPMPFGGAISQWLAPYPYAEAALSLLVLYLTAISVTRLVSRNLLFPARTYVFLILMLIAGYGLFIRSGNLPAVVAAWLTAQASEYFASSFRRTARLSDSFRGALLLGCAPLFYAPATIYLLLMPVAMPIYMRGWRESIVALVGMLFPVFAFSYVTWAAGEPFLALYTDIADTLLSRGTLAPLCDVGSAEGIARVFTAAMLVVAVLLSIATFVMSARQIRTRAYRIYLYMLLFLLLSVAGLALPCASVGDLPLVAMPVAIVATFYFSRFEGRFPAIIYALTIAGAVVCNLLPIFI